MNHDDYGKLTYMIMNQKGMTPQAKLDMIYKASLLMVDTSWGKIDPTVVLTQERTTVETVIPKSDFDINAELDKRSKQS